MKKIKVSEATGIALDWLVAKCEGVNAEAFRLYYEPTEPSDYDSHGYPEFHYSTTWAQGGPIIEREHISTNWLGTHWQANVGFDPESGESDADEAGHTCLVAAMRCYVASKLGEEVEVPEELT